MEHGLTLRLFENEVMSRICGNTKGGGGWSKLCNEELHNLYFSRPNIN
jgi:hypothetical protein